MKARNAWFYLLAGLPAASGCSLYQSGLYNLGNEPKMTWSSHHLTHDIQKQARITWGEYVQAHPGECFSRYFEDGFLDGYVDYLDNGGTGEPPAMPPQRYRKNKFMTPEGYSAIEDYFAGFRLGSRIAIASGIRDTLVVPILIPLGNVPGNSSRSVSQGVYNSAGASSPVTPPSVPALGGIETLPAPKAVDEPAAENK
ncbi:hypothetical protein KIH39_20275 [Telmatocola sphagniphila]|uniref:Uncharacterized protein n=1 Tax=Telmatocola sphagniphila TaxID=1123043 RepID=A0A8E6EUE8_9BACT|nr:hypothetical protein [Telmatocola sphagniphila]QVL31162.1 hypothetical protein KIH39_20275 [Telmatocola sphagniphila]